MSNYAITLTIKPPFLLIKPFVTEKAYYREVAEAPEDGDWEYLDGRLVIHSPETDSHAELFEFLQTLLSGYLDERGGAIVLGSGYPMRLDERWSPTPDLLVVRNDRRHLLGAARLEGPADLVIEIASASDPGLHAREKLPRYHEAGIEEIWLVNPFDQTVLAEVREPAGYTSQRLATGQLTSRVVHGFWIEVGWLWQERLPSTLACFQEIVAKS